MFSYRSLFFTQSAILYFERECNVRSRVCVYVCVHAYCVCSLLLILMRTWATTVTSLTRGCIAPGYVCVKRPRVQPQEGRQNHVMQMRSIHEPAG